MPNKDISKSASAALKRALARRKEHAAHCIGLYSCRSKEGVFGVPFLSVSNKMACDSVKLVCPLLNVYHIGYFFIDTGKVESLKRPVLCLDSEVIENE